MSEIGKLTLVPTPLDDSSPLEPVALSRLEQAVRDNQIIVVEEHRSARRRWLSWGLPREAIEEFKLLNEQNFSDQTPELVSALKSGRNVYLMSDGGLPCFCDPGRVLVESCHDQGVRVTSTPFPNSLMLAIALSGFDSDRFRFSGFPPRDKKERSRLLSHFSDSQETVAMLERPYAFVALLEEVASVMPKRTCFLALNLNHESEEVFRGTASSILKMVRSKGIKKAEPVLLISPRGDRA